MKATLFRNHSLVCLILCYWLTPLASADSAFDANAAPYELVNTPPLTVYGITKQVNRSDMASVTRETAIALAKTAVRKGGKIDGPLLMLMKNQKTLDTSAKQLKFTLAYPIKGPSTNHGKMKRFKTKAFYAGTMIHEGDLDSLEATWQELYERLINDGHEPSGEVRQQFIHVGDTANDDNRVELQLGLKQPG